MADTYKARVERGAVLLDELVNENWWERIDIPTLDMACGEHCILGQLFDSDPLIYQDGNMAADGYDAGLQRLGIGSGNAAEDHGFECHHDVGMAEHNDEYRWLQVRWRQLIEKRRNAQ